MYRIKFITPTWQCDKYLQCLVQNLGEMLYSVRQVRLGIGKGEEMGGGGVGGYQNEGEGGEGMREEEAREVGNGIRERSG